MQLADCLLMIVMVVLCFQGTEYIYQTFVKPYLSQHTESVDLNLVLVRDETVRVLTILWNRFVYYVHLKFSGVLHQNAVPSPNIASPLVQVSVFCSNDMLIEDNLYTHSMHLNSFVLC